MAIVYKNAEYRNLQEQVLKNAQDIEILKEKPSLKIVIVEELPETGEEGILYLVPKNPDPDTGDADSYDEYVWLPESESFELVGTTAIDLQNLPSPVYVTTDNKPEGLSYGLRIRNNGWTSDLQQEGGAKLELTGTAVNVTATNGISASAINSASTLGLFGYVGTNTTGFTLGNGIIQANRNIAPTTDGGRDLGSGTIRWGTVYANSLNLSTNATITKDSSNRLNLNNGGNVRIKVGGVDSTYCVANWTPDIDGTYSLGKDNMRWTDVNTSTVSNDYSNLTLKGNPGITVQLAAGGAITPSQNNSYKIGSESSRFNTVFTTTISNATKYVNVSDIVTKPDYVNPDVFEEGTLNASGQGTIDMTQTGVPEDGLYMFTYGNCQCFLTLTSTMIQNASQYPIRCTCPMMFNGSAYPGILKIERSSDLLTLTVATAGVGNVQPAGFEWKLIKVM